MMTSPFSWLNKAGVLGMNRRNAEYIMRWNPRSRYPLVDDKIITKDLAIRYEIPTPPLIHVVSHHGEVKEFGKNLAGHKEFAVKPARGAGGEGIVLIKDSGDEGFIKQSGDILTKEDISYHISSILSGIYSLGALEDRAIIEELIHPDPVFATVTYRGVPDIRIIVYRGVPAMAMVRLPTRASDGKANLHQGAIGAGLDLCSGVLLKAVHHNEVVTHHPDTGNPVTGITVPDWEKIMNMAARAFDMTGLGYLGVDMVMDEKRGPLLLELNARPGIQIQLANGLGLRKRLDRIDGAPAYVFITPESRVRWAREAFCGDT
jgi:alpha-L-glutamate ligase-like protein